MPQFCRSFFVNYSGKNEVILASFNNIKTLIKKANAGNKKLPKYPVENRCKSRVNCCRSGIRVLSTDCGINKINME